MIKVAIHGVPRSGTTWLGEIFNSSPSTIYKFQPLFSYAFKGSIKPTSSRKEISFFFERLLDSDDDFLNQIEKRNTGILPEFKKKKLTHLVYKEVRYHHILRNLMCRAADLQLIAIIRNPVSVINSWLCAPREFRADLGWSPAGEWQYALSKNQDKPEEFNGYEKWKEAARIFLDLSSKIPERVFVVKYEDLLKSPVAETRRMFDFCRLPFTAQTENFIADSQRETNSDEYSVFRKASEVGKGFSDMDTSIIEFIRNDLAGTDLEEYLR